MPQTWYGPYPGSVLGSTDRRPHLIAGLRGVPLDLLLHGGHAGAHEAVVSLSGPLAGAHRTLGGALEGGEDFLCEERVGALTLEVRPDPNFTRSGPDLYLEVPVSLPELMLGAAIQVPTPDGPVTSSRRLGVAVWMCVSTPGSEFRRTRSSSPGSCAIEARGS